MLPGTGARYRHCTGTGCGINEDLPINSAVTCTGTKYLQNFYGTGTYFKMLRRKTSYEVPVAVLFLEFFLTKTTLTKTTYR
jgi:hypothetical protein